jgi:hypothetical protein
VGNYFMGREIIDGDLSDLKNLRAHGKIGGFKNQRKCRHKKFLIALYSRPGANKPLPFPNASGLQSAKLSKRRAWLCIAAE